MNIEIKKLPNIAKKLVFKFKPYFGFIFLVSVLLIYSFLVFKVNQLNQMEPSDDEIAAKLNNIKRLKIDQGSLDKIKQLEDQNVGVQSLFQEARQNPFD